MRERRGLTRRKLFQVLGINRNYILAIEANGGGAGPKLQDQLLVNPETGDDRRLVAKT
jgi:transcriptional regulator with XRE-family HTH domain